MSGPLDNITVLDLTRVLSGPYATMWLADMGADIIKVERPETGDDTRQYGPPFVSGESAYFMSVNRNKKSITLDFKSEEGKDVLWDLIEESDVLIENFRPGTLDKIGFGYDDVSERYPEIIYTSISGFGHTGPDKENPGFDLTIQGLSGIMSITGSEDGPPRKVGVAISDLVTGIYAAMGTSMALYHRETTGDGQHVDVGMFDSMISLLSYQAGRFFATDETPGRIGNLHPTISPYETFETSDGYMNLALGNQDLFEDFCELIDRTDILEDDRFENNPARVEHRDIIHELIEEETVKKTTDEWLNLLKEAEIPAAPIQDLQEVFEHPQTLARDMLESVRHPETGDINVTGIPIKMSQTEGEIDEPPPRLGEHTREILGEILEYDSDDIEDLVNEDVVDPYGD